MNSIASKIQLDFRSSEPIYLQLTRQIEALVRMGDLKQGDQLPTVRELATDLRINFSTVARAYKTLDEERLISTQRGRGTYIWEEPSGETLQRLQEKTLRELGQRYLDDAGRLGLTPQAALENLRSILSASAEPPGVAQSERDPLKNLKALLTEAEDTEP